MNIATYVLLGLGALLLFGYPLVFVADVMSLAAPRPDEVSASSVAILVFLYGSLAYPAVYLVFATIAIVMIRKGRGKPAFWFAIGPVIYAVVLAGLLGALGLG